jgi:hypothetical protein
MIDDRTAARTERQMSFKSYKKMKLKMLKRDFCIALSDEELKRAESLKNEIQVDQFCIDMFNKKFG